MFFLFVILEEELSLVPPLQSPVILTLLGWGHEAQNELSTLYCCGAPIHCLYFKEYVQYSGITEDESTLVFFIRYRCSPALASGDDGAEF